MQSIVLRKARLLLVKANTAETYVVKEHLTPSVGEAYLLAVAECGPKK